MENPVHCPESSPSMKSYISPELKQDTSNEQIDGSKLESSHDTKQLQESGSSTKKLGAGKVSGPSEDTALTSSACATDALGCDTENGLQAHTSAKNKDLCSKTSSFDDVSAAESAAKRGISDCRAANDYRSTIVSRNKEGGNCTIDESRTFLSRMDEEHISDKNDDLPANISASKPHSKDPEAVQKKSVTDLDCDIDALEVARQVAIEVEKEVDCREQSSSSSDRVPGNEIQQPDSADSAHGPQSHAQEDSPQQVPAAPDLSAEASPEKEEEPETSAGSLDAEPINGTQETDCSQITDVAQELPCDPAKDVCNFDLNQEVCSEDVYRPDNLTSTPISVVSASRAAAAPGLPVAPLQFEGALGWKGSAATSAFRPASPRRIPEADKAHSTGGSNSSKRDGFLDIDLNIDESVEEKITDPLLEKQIPVSSGLPSGESSVEASSRRSERIELDLNRAGEDADAPSDWRTEGVVLHHRNGFHSQSPSSSSSSKQPSLRNIDLNNQPSFVNETSDHPFLSKFSQSFNASGVKRSDDSVITIMGMKVEVNRKDFVPQPLPLLNGRSLEPAFDVNLARSGNHLRMGPAVPYTHSPVYGYHGLASGPPTMAFSSGMYGPSGPIPYMLDSRGAPVVHQFMSSASALPPVFSHAPFMMSMTGTPASNGAGPSRNCFDTNSGMILEGGNRDTGGGLRLFLNPGQARSMDEQLKPDSQASTSSSVGVKRREPDGGWEPYPFKHNPSPW